MKQREGMGWDIIGNHKALLKLISQATIRHSAWDIYRDFLALSAIAISNAVDINHRDSRENEYMDIIKKYTRQEIDLFPQMLCELVKALEGDPRDVLGKIYGELELGNKWIGQFFTPDHLALAMAKTMVVEAKETIAQKGYISLCDPAIGGGAMIINFAKALLEDGVNYQQVLRVEGWDIDIKSIHMSYLQLSLLNIPAVLVHGDSLAQNIWAKWYTPAYILGGWAWKRERSAVVKRRVAEEMSLFEAV